MKIKTKKLDYDKVVTLKKEKHRLPLKPSIIFRLLIRVLSIFDLAKVSFKYTKTDMDKVKGKPCLILMNHSSFIDLKIASAVLFPRPFCIVCTSDGFVGKNLLMRLIGCIPTAKFVSDTTLIRDMQYAINDKKASILMYPEASYSFDGTATPLPRKLGALLKRLDVPVVSIITSGAFSRDPLYNGLQLRKVKVSADVRCFLDENEIREKSVEELDEILDNAFSFDAFKWQKENNIHITEPFRADGLERILYKCASCGVEGYMFGKGEELICRKCGKKYTLTTLGELKALEGETEISHIPDWFSWQRDCVRKEIENGDYILDTDVEIGMLVNRKAVYMVGEGRLTHTKDGFTLTGCDGRLNYSQKPLTSYSLYSDYYWYEIGDVICIGKRDCLYYCFPKGNCSVAKARLAAEEIYKLHKRQSKLLATK